VGSSNPGVWKYTEEMNPITFDAISADHASGRVTVRWSVAGDDGVQGYRVYRALAGEPGLNCLTSSAVSAEAPRQFFDDGVEPGKSYDYRVTAITPDGEWVSPIVSISVPEVSLDLLQNYPNPFNPTTTIPVVLPQRSTVHLAVYDVTGALITTLVDQDLGPGRHGITWNGTDVRGNVVSAGVYFCRLTTTGVTLSRKMVLLK
jgi:hypothetical protein